MKRIIIICEGPTEQEFCKTALRTYLQAKNIYIQPPLIKHTGGGIVKWSILKNQIENHLKEDRTAIVTTLIDYYGLHTEHGFPQWEECEKIEDKVARMNALELAMHNDIDSSMQHRYIPYIQLHEFEGLLFNDINIFYSQIPAGDIVDDKELKSTFASYNNHEMINNNKETSPSRRLERIIRGYNKVVYGNILAEAIGLHQIRSKSPRFNSWVCRLENI